MKETKTKKKIAPKTEQEKVIQRLNRIIGQLEGLKKMITEGKPCTDTLVQFKASKSALESTLKVYAKNELHLCMANPEKRKKEKDWETIIESLVK